MLKSKAGRYLVALLASLGFYVLLLIASGFAQQWLAPTGAGRVVIGLMPMLGALVVAVTVIGTLRQLDELQRRIQLEAIAMSFVGTALITFAWGFAEDAGLPRMSTFAVWPLMAVLWVVGLFFAGRRYQ
jgi:uncharacterized membrane protein (DUF485 family)